MKDRIKFFIEKDAFESFILNEPSFNNMLAILCEHSVLCLNMTEEDIKKEWKSSCLDGQRGGSIIQKFRIGHSGMRRPISSYLEFGKFYTDYDSLLEHSRSIFILNVTPEEAEDLKSMYGLMVISKQKLLESDSVFQFHIKDSVAKGEIKRDHTDGWDYFFSLRKHPWLPSNALVISDEYLFKNEDRGQNLGVRNLKSIISNLLPKQLGTEFQILVISPIPNDNKKKAQKIADEMTEFVHNLSLPYDCKITFVFTNATHTRKAMSNYYVMTCDKGFCVYLCKPMNEVKDTNFVDITSDFHSAADSSGTNGYDDTTMCLDKLKSQCESAQSQVRNSKIPNPSALITGDCGPNFEIYNRLIGMNY